MSHASADDAPRPRFSVVTAVYNVSRYLADFIASIEHQDLDPGQIEVVAVDDGSTDDSLAVLQSWRDRRPGLVTVLTKENGGQGSARNVGLEHARGEWVTFTDPDDTLAPDYFSRVAWAIDKEPTLAMVATNRIIHQDETGELLDIHPLRAMFAHRDQFKDLDEFPDFFHGSAPAAFFRAADIERYGLRFDERIRPNFEDGHFCQRYLLRADQPYVAFLRSARYHYRKRLDQSSTLQTGSLQPSRFLQVPQHGYLELLQEGAGRFGGRAPEWLQNMIIYELSYYISPEDAGWDSITACRGPVAVEFVSVLREIRRELDDEVIEGFTARRLKPEWRQLLLYGLVDKDWHSPYLVLHRYDERHEHVLVSYRYTGDEPEHEVIFRGRTIEPVATKIRAHVYWEHTLLRERLMWVPAAGTLRARLGGRLVEIRGSWSNLTPTALRPAALRRRFGVQSKDPEDASPALRPPRTDDAVRRLAKTPAVRKLFGSAWVLMDRVADAGDNAERLFEYLRVHHRDINAWFVVHPDSPDYARLKKQGHRRVVGYGTLAWKLLMLNCEHLISSHVDVPVVRPADLATLIPKPAWKFTFLQHGVIKDDISGWLNPKRIDLFITSTPAEHTSIVGDDTRYAFTTKQVQRTGLPRFDRLRELGQRVGEAECRTILVAPTWRDWLAEPLKAGAYRRQVIADFGESEYAQNWMGLLGSERLRTLCAEFDLRIGLLPHPNMQQILRSYTPPSHVDALTYADHDVQELFVRAAVLVTDYSSVAFNAAYVDRPLVYFQFDAERVELGGHLGRKGYFDYDRDGFGPVSYTLAEAEGAIESMVRAGRRTVEPYAGRIRAAFPDRDGRCCERVTAAIRAL